MNDKSVLWEPQEHEIEVSKLRRFMTHVEAEHSLKFSDYWALDAWSVENPEKFWSAIWDFCNVISASKTGAVLVGGSMPGSKWFPETRLNFAENLLRRRDDGVALVFWGEDRVKRSVTYRELYDSVSVIAQALRSQGVGVNDRVVGYLPNMPEAIMMMLATTSIGAVWASCSPDFGVRGAVDRFGQIEPTVMIGVDGYFQSGQVQDTLKRLHDISKQMPTLKRVIIVPYVSNKPSLPADDRFELLENFLRGFNPGSLKYEQLPFDHPVYIMFSSGTTGIPKCIVHGAGGTLLQHLKEHMLHVDIQEGDRLFYHTTCGWMMWNWLVSGLAAGATLLLYDGSPLYRKGQILFDFVDESKMSIFGTSAKFIEALAKANVVPKASHSLASLRVMLSTGSPLSPESFKYVYEKVKDTLRLSSISGGTDIVSCFLVGNPLLPVHLGEMQCRGLGLKVEVYNSEGKPVSEEKGELVCTAPFPCMPVGFWNDPDGAKYRAAYFEKFPGVWAHGDYAERTRHNGFIIYGRSDAVLNPGGVRIGTAEIYREVEKLPEIVESIAVGQEFGGDTRVILFVKLRENINLNDSLRKHISTHIRDNASAHHVPAKIIQVTDIPRTKSGKIVELAVREIIHGRPVKNIEALANPEALEYFRNIAEISV